MKYSTIVLSAFAAAVYAQDAPTTVESAPSGTVSLRPEVSCANACPAGDVNCQAKCVGVPFPDGDQINQTTECAGNCDQGSGSTEDSLKYSDCVQSCISSYFLSATAAPTSGGASPSGAAGTTGPSGAENTGAPSGTTGGSQPTSSQGVAANVRMGAATGFFGLVMAIFAL